MSESHAHFPDYAYYHRRQHPKQLTCTQCGKPIHCTNEHLNLFGFLPVIPIAIAFIFQNEIAFGICLLAAMLLNEPINRFIFPRLHFEIDYDAMRGKLSNHRRFI